MPRTDTVLADPRLVDAATRLGPGPVKQAVRSAQQQVRDGALAPDDVADAAVAGLPAGPRAVLNATGVVLHTNLGRAPLSDAVRDALLSAAGYTDVEFDLATGARARRGRGALAALRAAVPAAGDAMVVNNGAAALLLAVTALAAGREVIVSRGELVEIGDGFRLPELIESAGARIREVGTTNRTHVADYADAVDERTGCILKVHPSNFRVAGFTSAASVRQLGDLGAPLVVDIGSGLLSPDPVLPDEPDMTGTLQAGADLVTASGDKLLGGPQAGLLLGRSDLIERLRRHPMARALRVDKLTLAALEATLHAASTLSYDFVHVDAQGLRERCAALAAAVDGDVVPSAGAVGGGGAPGVELPGWAVALPVALAAPLRTGTPPVVGRVQDGRLLLDLRCIPVASDRVVRDAVLAVR